MGSSQRLSPESHWSWPEPAVFQPGVAKEDMIFVGGQVDLDARGRVRHPGDFAAQEEAVFRAAEAVLAEAGATLNDVVKVTLFYVPQEGMSELQLGSRLRGHFSEIPPVFTVIPVPFLCNPGLLLALDLVAMRSATGRMVRQAFNPTGHWATAFSHGLRCGNMLYVGGQVALGPEGQVLHPGDIVRQSEAVMGNMERVLAGFGATLNDSVKFNIWYAGKGAYADWEGAAKVRARYFKEPGPVATGIPVSKLEPDGILIKMEVWAMLGPGGAHLRRHHYWPDGHWDWAIHLPYRHGLKCENLFFVGGQISADPKGKVLHPGDIETQTTVALENIRRVVALIEGAEMKDVLKVTTYYKGESSVADHQRNLRLRSAAFATAAPAATDVALPAIAYEDMMIEIEAVGMTG